MELKSSAGQLVLLYAVCCRAVFFYWAASVAVCCGAGVVCWTAVVVVCCGAEVFCWTAGVVRYGAWQVSLV